MPSFFAHMTSFMQDPPVASSQPASAPARSRALRSWRASRAHSPAWHSSSISSSGRIVLAAGIKARQIQRKEHLEDIAVTGKRDAVLMCGHDGMTTPLEAQRPFMHLTPGSCMS